MCGKKSSPHQLSTYSLTQNSLSSPHQTNIQQFFTLLWFAFVRGNSESSVWYLNGMKNATWKFDLISQIEKKKCNSWRFIPTNFLLYLFSRPTRQEPVTFKWKFYYLACDQRKRKFNSRIWLFKIGNSMKKILEKLSRWRASSICMEKRKCQSESACVGQTKKMTSDINILFFQITGSSYELTHWRTSMMRSKMCLEQDATRILFDPFIWPFSLCRFLRMWLFSPFVWLAGFVWAVDEPINTSNNGSISFSTESICVWIVTDIFIRSTNKKP